MLIKCPECGKYQSNHLVKCGNCGHPLPYRKHYGFNWITLSIYLAVIPVVIISIAISPLVRLFIKTL